MRAATIAMKAMFQCSKNVRKPLLSFCVSIAQSRLTPRLTDAGPMMYDCQPRRDPGVRCSRFVSFWDFHFLLLNVLVAPMLPLFEATGLPR